MKQLHNKLLQHSRRYRTWHQHPLHKHVHWGLLAAVVLGVALSLVMLGWSEAEVASVQIARAQSTIPAFPGCEGFGCETPGGRGGTVVFVTNLNDSGPGSLRAALMMTEPRIIVFKVSGTIFLNSPLRLTEANSYVTVAGQTAPGDGIAIALHPVNGLEFEGTHDVVLRYLRIRGGERTVMATSGSYNIIFDHNSFTWATDQIVNLWGNNIHDITWSWNIIAEGNLGSLFSGGYPHARITLHHNYLSHTKFRNYKVDAGSYDFINNINYNTFGFDYHFDQNQYTGSDPISPDVINHYFKEGPNTNRHKPFDIIRARAGTFAPISLYLTGNKYVDINENSVYDVNDQWSMTGTRSWPGTGTVTYEKRFQPHTVQPQFPVTIHSTDEGKDLVLAQAGPRPLDAVDARLLGDFTDGGGYDAGNIGQFPSLQTYNVPQDNDNDGMPDDWEIAHGLNPNDPSDNTKDRNGDGYTNIEEWIFSLSGETLSDGPVCPNGTCEARETAASCPQDCGSTQNQPPRNLRLRYLGPTP